LCEGVCQDLIPIVQIAMDGRGQLRPIVVARGERRIGAIMAPCRSSRVGAIVLKMGCSLHWEDPRGVGNSPEAVWDGGSDWKPAHNKEQVVNDLDDDDSLLQWPACLISWSNGCGTMHWSLMQGRYGSSSSLAARR
jgi:hypothetical protein